MNLIEIYNLTYSFFKKKIFSNISINIKPGTFVTIAGNNSSGKTTLIKLLSGRLMTNDVISIDGVFINNQNKEIIDKKVCIFSYENKYFSKTVFNELIFEIKSNNYDDVSKVKQLLHEFNMIDYIYESPQTLNYIQRQKLSLIKAILKESKVLLLDNIFCHFDRYSKIEFIGLLKKYQSIYNFTIILTTNTLEDSIFSDRLIVINDGGILIDGSPENIFKEEKLLKRIGLNIPMNYDLCNKLSLYGLIAEKSFNIDDMVEEICK